MVKNGFSFSDKRRKAFPAFPCFQCLQILEKYQNHPQCCNQDRVFPVWSKQKMNEYLKEIANLCGIHKTLTYHVARHTFATTVTLGNGVPMETVAKMLGHSSLRTTQHYARILDNKISEDMKRVRDKYTHKTVEYSQS